MSSSPAPSLDALLDESEWVRALARRLVTSTHEAEDLAQETMAQALSSPPADGRSLRGWLGTVLTNRLRARRRSPDPASELVRDQAVGHEPSALETVERAEAHQLVVDAVMSLGEPFRMTVLLRYFEGLGPSEIAARQGVPLATVTSRLTRAHTRLRERLGEGAASSETRLACLAPLFIPVVDAGSGRTAAPVPALPQASLLIAMTTSAKFLSAAVLVALGVLLGSAFLEPADPSGAGPDVKAADAGRETLEARETLVATEKADANRVGLAGETAATPGSATAPEPALADGLTGTVLRPDGSPAVGATVVLGGFGALQFIEDDKSPPKGLATAETSEDGSFRLGELPTKRVLVTAGGSGGAPSRSVVWAPGDRTELQLTLREGVRIYGSVHRRDGSLARGRMVRLMQDAGTKDPLGKRLIRWVHTDDQGQFDERALCPGQWGVVSYPEDDELKELGGSMVDHMVQATVQLADGEEAHVPLGARTPDSVHVTGRVTLAGEPASGILQWMREGPDPMGSQTNVELAADGSYDLDLEGPGTWYVRAMGDGSGEFFPSIPAVGEHTLDFELPTGTLSGQVVDEAGEPVAGVRVSLQATEAEYERGPLCVGEDATGTDKDGRFTFEGLPGGSYLVGAVHEKLGVASSMIVPLTGTGSATDIAFVLRGGHRIEGSVMGAEGFPALLSAVWIYDAEGRLLNPVAALCTQKNGSFATPPLPPGRYSLFVQSDLSVAQVEGVLVGDTDRTGIDLKLAPGAVLTVESLVNGSPRRALVSATDPRGRLLTGQRFRRNPWQWRRHPFNSKTKSIGPFPPGSYTVSSHVPGVGTATKSITVVGAEAISLTLRQ